MKLFLRVLEFLIFSNIYFGSCAAIFSLGVYYSFQSEYRNFPSASLLFILSSTIGAYSSLRKKGGSNSPNGSLNAQQNWLIKYDTFRRYLVLTCFSIAIFFSVFLSNIQLRITGVATILLLLYSSTSFCIPIPLQLRNNWILKPIVVAAVCSLIWVGLPLSLVIEHPGISTENLWLSILRYILVLTPYALFILSLVLLFEIKDRAIDIRMNITTVATIWGIRTTQWLAFVILLLATVLIMMVGNFSWIMSIPYLFYLLLTIIADWTSASDYFYWLVVDGALLLVGVFHLLAFKFYL